MARGVIAHCSGTWIAATLAMALAGRATAEAPGAQPRDPPQRSLTIIDLQTRRTQTQVLLAAAGRELGTATLTNLNPRVNAWLLLGVRWSAGRAAEFFHLENVHPAVSIALRTDETGALRVEFGDRSPECTLMPGMAAGETTEMLKSARASGLPYAPLCDGRLYLRNATVGRASTLERVTDFLRTRVWGGEEIVTLVKKELYQDAFLQEAPSRALRAPPPAEVSGPRSALVDRDVEERAVTPPNLGLDVDAPGATMRFGRWYRVRSLADVYFSAMVPDALEHELLRGQRSGVNLLDPVESKALVYLVAFDLERLDLHFALGTDHPRLGWSPRPPASSRDPRLPGPDGIDTPAPLVNTGMVSPKDQARTVATFAGGFKREHGAFKFGPLAERNHGSHYGFIEQGVVFSRLQPGLATVYSTVEGDVLMGTWTDADGQRLDAIRDARQNGVPLIDFDPKTGTSSPGALVNLWGMGNWSGSANEDLRTVRAGLCLQEAGERRFLIFGYFSAATPSAMARIFEAFRCRYAMQLDMNALEHTYLALYVLLNGHRTVEHLIDGMDVLDRHVGNELAPRFLGFPDDRDFFYLTRKQRP